MQATALAPGRIKTIRKARKIGRPKLAKLSGLTERKLAKIETSSAITLDRDMVERLSEVLGVPVPTLTGEFEIVDDDLVPLTTQKCSNGCCG